MIGETELKLPNLGLYISRYENWHWLAARGNTPLKRSRQQKRRVQASMASYAESLKDEFN
jgi:hypothetical protein